MTENIINNENVVLEEEVKPVKKGITESFIYKLIKISSLVNIFYIAALVVFFVFGAATLNGEAFGIFKAISSIMQIFNINRSNLYYVIGNAIFSILFVIFIVVSIKSIITAIYLNGQINKQNVTSAKTDLEKSLNNSGSLLAIFINVIIVSGLFYELELAILSWIAIIISIIYYLAKEFVLKFLENYFSNKKVTLFDTILDFVATIFVLVFLFVLYKYLARPAFNNIYNGFIVVEHTIFSLEGTQNFYNIYHYILADVFNVAMIISLLNLVKSIVSNYKFSHNNSINVGARNSLISLIVMSSIFMLIDCFVEQNLLLDRLEFNEYVLSDWFNQIKNTYLPILLTVIGGLVLFFSPTFTKKKVSN